MVVRELSEDWKAPGRRPDRKPSRFLGSGPWLRPERPVRPPRDWSAAKTERARWMSDVAQRTERASEEPSGGRGSEVATASPLSLF